MTMKYSDYMNWLSSHYFNAAPYDKIPQPKFMWLLNNWQDQCLGKTWKNITEFTDYYKLRLKLVKPPEDLR